MQVMSAAIVVALDRFGPADVSGLENVATEAGAVRAALVVATHGVGLFGDLDRHCERLGITRIPGARSSFGAAANAGARAPTSEAVVVCNGIHPSTPGLLRVLLEALGQPNVGVVGLGGLIVVSSPKVPCGFDFRAVDAAGVHVDCDALSGDFIATTRAAYHAVGGFDETLGYRLAGIDYCLRVGEIGRRILCEPAASLVPSSGEFVERWRGRVETHDNYWPERSGWIIRRDFYANGVTTERVAVPKIALLAHGPPPAERFVAALTAFRMPFASGTWADAAQVVRTARELTELRGPNYVAFIRSDTELTADTLNDLVNAIERAPGTAVAVMGSPPDGRALLVAPRLIPQHVRIESSGSFDESIAAWLGEVRAVGRTIACVTRTKTIVGPAAPYVGIAAPQPVRAVEPFVSIVMLSWNAPEYTEACIDSIRDRTKLPYEIIVIDNGSNAETVARLRAIPNIRVIYNAVNTGFAFGSNQGLAAARGTHVVLLNNDVVVTDGWLEPLIEVQRNHPTVGCSAPRSNEVAGQQRLDVTYRDLDGLQAFAAQRSIEHHGRWTYQARAVGLCMCLNRRMVDEIGGLDTIYGLGNFEDDDYSMRIRSAGYEIAVCDDSFIHHFGSVSFRANGVDYDAAFTRNKALLSERWNVEVGIAGYDSWHVAQRGFLRERDYVPLPPPEAVDSSDSIARG